MVQLASLGSTIYERRKAQGLTQEQLGDAVGVTGQAVSRWEKGESAPDIGLLPALCQTLRVSADTLLGVAGTVGIETLGDELLRRLDGLGRDERAAAMLGMYRRMHFSGQPVLAHAPGHGLKVHYEWTDEGLQVLKLWAEGGLACYVGHHMPTKQGDGELIAVLRQLLDERVWPVVQALSSGPKKKEGLMALGVVNDETELGETLSWLIETGVAVQKRQGYSLEEQHVATAMAVLVQSISSTKVVTQKSIGYGG